MTSMRVWAGVAVCALSLGALAVAAARREAKPAAVPVEACPSPAVVPEVACEVVAASPASAAAAPAPDSGVARMRTTMAALRERGAPERPSWQDLRAGLGPKAARAQR